MVVLAINYFCFFVILFLHGSGGLKSWILIMGERKDVQRFRKKNRNKIVFMY